MRIIITAVFYTNIVTEDISVSNRPHGQENSTCIIMSIIVLVNTALTLMVEVK